jgi:EAL domain-containing protein (putative c-di-GMP-specific phosphodiesterase class I)
MTNINNRIGERVLEAARRSAQEQSLNVVGVPLEPFYLAILTEPPAKRPFAPALYPESHGTSANEPEITEPELRGAIERSELELAYQPKIDCASRRVVGFEALVRWRRSNGDLVMPDRFIGVAERSDLVHALTDQVCKKALGWLKDSAAPPGSTLSINVSARKLADTQFADRLATLCADLGLDAQRVILELTESMAIEDPVAALAVITRFREKGFRLSIDDFGAGYSSMAQLIRLPLSELKIDRSLVADAAHSDESRTVVGAIVELGHRLGLTLTAEGVEDPWTMDLLQYLGCDLAQGYHIARPMPGSQVAAWLASVTGQ